jgi:hypothetical protein
MNELEVPQPRIVRAEDPEGINLRRSNHGLRGRIGFTGAHLHFVGPVGKRVPVICRGAPNPCHPHIPDADYGLEMKLGHEAAPDHPDAERFNR